MESLREKDETFVENVQSDDNELLRNDLEGDEFSSYFMQTYEPKVLITYSDNPMKVFSYRYNLFLHLMLINLKKNLIIGNLENSNVLSVKIRNLTNTLCFKFFGHLLLEADLFVL